MNFIKMASKIEHFINSVYIRYISCMSQKAVVIDSKSLILLHSYVQKKVIYILFFILCLKLNIFISAKNN